ncbi:cupin domain-containing protein [Streptomyces sp. NPDC048514]|uniref:cupin domain-containing protein n=1 Tax=Streptomyces sp. NPDC048514 TaxID=3365564 RepID=UPI003720ADB9
MAPPPTTGSGPWEDSTAGPRVLCDTRALVQAPPAPAGVLWKLAESGRQLDANVVRLPPGGRITAHTETQLDVMLFVVAGTGVLGDELSGEPQPLGEGALVWLPRGAARSVTAAESGLTYLTVHRRRPGMWIGSRPPGTPTAPTTAVPPE